MNIISISCILLGFINVGFFIYSNVKISVLKEGISDECKDYLYYNFKIVLSFLFSIIIAFLNLCCSQLVSVLLYCVNGVIIGSLAVSKYYSHNDYCDEICKRNCQDTVELSQKIDIFFITNISFICLSVVLFTVYYIKKLCFNKE
jgi:hypothetical protein